MLKNIKENWNHNKQLCRGSTKLGNQLSAKIGTIKESTAVSAIQHFIKQD